MPHPVRLVPLLLALLAAAPAARPAAAAALPDSTTQSAWRLANGLEVRVRETPGVGGVAITVAYRAGWAGDPPARPGLAELLAEVDYTAAAGDVPERSRREMDSLRPLGWGVSANARFALLTEVASREQFPGALHQVAARMRGVGVTDAGVRAALATLRADMGTRYFGDPAQALYWRAAALAAGRSDEEIVRDASLRALDGLGARDVQGALARLYVPANAVLAIAGDVSGVDVRALVEHEFGGIAAGAAQAVPDTLPFHPQRRRMEWPGLEQPLGVLAVRSPSLADSLHPAFYLGLLVTASALQQAWGAPTAPLTSRFQYALFDEPDLIRFYPRAAGTQGDPERLADALFEQLDVVARENITMQVLNALRAQVDWLLGGPLPPDVRARLRRDPGGLGTLTTCMATRALGRGDAFWDDYRRRFERTPYGPSTFYGWLTNPAEQVALQLVPRP